MKKSLVILGSTILLAIGAYSAMTLISKDDKPVATPVSSVKTATVTEPSIATPVVSTPQSAIVANTTEPAKTETVLSNQEYGEKYLDLSGNNQECFNIMVNESYPDRFTESNREENIIKLSKVITLGCGMGITVKVNDAGKTVRYFNFFGEHGEFFDQ